MKRIFLGILAAAICLSTVACGGGKREGASPTGAAAKAANSGGGANSKVLSTALSALKKGDAAAFAAAIEGVSPAALSGLFASEYVSPGGDFSYDLNETGDGIIIKEYTGSNPVLIIPAEIEGYPVVQLGIGHSITDDNVTTVIIPEGVKIIEENCFVTKRSLTSVVFPSTLTKIGKQAFYYCEKLVFLDLSNTAFSEIGEEAFLYCRNLQSVKLPDSVKKIDGSAFAGCPKLTSINIPAGIETIGGLAFQQDGELYNLSIPDSISSITFDHGSDEYPDYQSPFEGCGKLPLATRKRLQDLGYQGSF
jgi:hypothetical protein